MRYIMIEETVQVLLMQLAHFNLVAVNQKTVTGHSCDSIIPFVHLPYYGDLSSDRGFLLGFAVKEGLLLDYVPL